MGILWAHTGAIVCIGLNHQSVLSWQLLLTPCDPLRTVERLDLEEGKWILETPMLSRRSTLGVAVLNGILYAVGGFDGTTGLETVEKYDQGMATCKRETLFN